MTWSSIVTDPPVPLLTPAQLEAAARIVPGNEEAALEPGYIAAATEYVQRRTGYALATQTILAQIDVLPSGPFALPWPPLQALTSITGADGVPIDPALYVVDTTSRPARVTFPATPPGTGPYSFEMIVGFGDPTQVSPLYLHVVQLLAAHLLTTGRDLAIVGTIVADTPFGFEDLIGPLCLLTLA
jgi:uncharacterized phiE125 gp8 family phage protein